ncbi:hypothetical protein EUGRSUZ_K00610 [Eucalyptus grandis]|uniref:Uncharacterized protein n=2 Tax=Eucalyptus grandis TaxID=71139 RepID=A0ACC3ISA7_EUCGR|nr:hypothetical protein EUGRSUZ_K00610 [Eucalyptus grandis]
MEDVPSISIFKTTERCDHSFCSHCMSSYIVAKIKDGSGKAMLDPITCKQLVSSVGFARRSDVLCYCPNLSCRDGCLFKCPSCNGGGWFRDEDIHLLERLAERQRWKRCPQCHVHVECSGGRKKMGCRCKTQFCHGCGRKRGPSSSCACRKEFCLGHSFI